jgi:hypothetical protein
MSGAASTAQWTENEVRTTATLQRAYLVTNGDGYSFSTTGPADAYLVDDGSGNIVIDTDPTGAKRLAMNALNEVLIY